MAEGFLEGFVKATLAPSGAVGGAQADLEGRRKSRIELAMLSRRIEMEAARREAEAQAEFERKRLSVPASQDLFGAVDPKTSYGSLFGAKGLSGPDADAYKFLLGNKTKTDIAEGRNKDPFGVAMVRFITRGNKTVAVFTDPSAPDDKSKMRILGEFGLTGTARRRADEIQNATTLTHALLDKYEEGVKKFLVSGGRLATLKNKAGMKWREAVQSDPELSAWLDSLDYNNLLQTFERSGKQTNKTEVVTMAKAMPNENDSLEVALEKLGKVRDYVSRTGAQKLEAIGASDDEALSGDKKDRKKAAEAYGALIEKAIRNAQSGKP